jgi:hypothetical protein
MTQRATRLEEGTRALVKLTGRLARHCDRAEHNEPVSRDLLLEAARELRYLAVDLSRTLDLDLRESYATRLHVIETRHPLGGLGQFNGAEAIRASKTWADIQRAQFLHDVTYHPDVVGLAKFEQLRHYTLHLTKLCGYAQEAVDSDEKIPTDFTTQRIADLLIFGIKLSTVVGETLHDEAVGF